MGLTSSPGDVPGLSELQRFEALVHRMEPQSRLLSAWPLAGGVSAQMTAIEIERPDGVIAKMVVRCHGEVDRAQNPDIAAHEFRLLQILRSAGIAVPAPIYLDRSNTIFPTPCIVVEHIDGETEFAPPNMPDAIRQMAAQLAQIHRLNESNADIPFLPSRIRGFGDRPATLDESLSEERIREALESAWPLLNAETQNTPVLLHGDFWPGNILWRNGQLVAVIDWEDAKVGDPLADVGSSRLEILWAFGGDAMHQFTQCYQAKTEVSFTRLAYWDLCAALRPAGKLGHWGLDAGVENSMRVSHAWFVEQALTDLEDMTGVKGI